MIHDGLRALLEEHRPDCVAIEDVFHARNVRSALKLGHARGVALLAATAAGVSIAAYTPAEVKRAVVGYGRAEKQQVQQMVCLLLGLKTAPTPLDASDALAIAICHMNRSETAGAPARVAARSTVGGLPRSWRGFDPASHLRLMKKTH
jgi:crossover junction endodeoxyribonuclease RuvC